MKRLEQSLKYIPTIALIIIHLLFAIFIIAPLNLTMAFSFIGLLPTYFFFSNKLDKIAFTDLSIDLIAFFIGVSFTLWLQISYELSNTFSAATTGVVVAFIPPTILGTKTIAIRNFNQAKLSAYSGAFAGMTSLTNIDAISNLILISIIGGSIHYLFRNSFIGLGGKLGSIGFASIILHLIINGLI